MIFRAHYDWISKVQSGGIVIEHRVCHNKINLINCQFCSSNYSHEKVDFPPYLLDPQPQTNSRKPSRNAYNKIPPTTHILAITQQISITMEKSIQVAMTRPKKHHRSRSQQPLASVTPASHSSHIVEVLHKNGEVVRMAIAPQTPMGVVKDALCRRLDLDRNRVYFYVIDGQFSLDYTLEEEIGCLGQDCRLGYEFIQALRQQQAQSEGLSGYKVYECLSVGGFSKVFLVRSRRSGKFYAAKFISKAHQQQQKFQQLIYNQKYINQLLDHPMLVKMHQFIQTREFYIFVLDYCPSGELFCLMKENRNMTEEDARFYFIETVLGIEYMHSKSIIYRDIKPENILLDKDGHVKIADFGLAKIMREKSTSYCGSLEYMAPEIVQGREHSFGVDHYCLGSLLYELMIGCPPFYNPNFSPSQTKHHIVNSDVRFPSRKALSPNFIDFVMKLLDKNPKTRLGSIGGIKEILAHPWVGKFDRKAYENHLISPPIRKSLDHSNFQTTYLPKQAIEETMMKIQIEIEQQQRRNATFSKTDKNSFTSIPMECQKPRRRLQSTDMYKKFSSSSNSLSKNVENHNPYANVINKQHASRSQVRNTNKIFSKSLHVSPNEKAKNRVLSKEKKASQFSSKANLVKNLIKMNNNRQKSLHRRSVENLDQFKKTFNFNLFRKSNNIDKQNQMKQKFEAKSKMMKKSTENNQGLSQNPYLSKKISKTLINPFYK